eukprot:g12778.t1
MRRYRSEWRDPEGNGPMSLEESQRKDRLASAAGEKRRPASASLSAGVEVGFGAVVVATVAAKLHKYGAQGGGRLTHGAAAVLVEDVTLFLGLYVLWHVVRWSSSWLSCSERLRRKPPLAVAVLLWTSIVSVTFWTLAYVAIEHLYFCSTSSLLDYDALVVAKRSLGPIIFISLQVEGERAKRMALIGSGVLVATGLAAFKVRQWAASRAASSNGGGRQRRALKGLTSLCRTATAMASRLLPRQGVPLPTNRACAPDAVVPKVPTVVFALSGLVFFWAALGPGLLASKTDHSRVRLLRRNCFVAVIEGLRSTPSGDGMMRWAAAVSAALSPRVLGGVEITMAGPQALEHHAKLFDAVQAARKRSGAISPPPRAAHKPNVVVVVLESTTGTLATASNSHGVSPWLKELSTRGMSSSKFYSSMPNTNKAMYQVMCGMTPSLETAWVEFDRPDILEAVCLPGLLRSKLGYRSLLLTGSMVGGLGVFGHDDAIGYAAEEEQGGRADFMARNVNDKFTFEHGTFEKVNYLGYDDHVVLNRSISFLAEENENVGTGGRLLTILTVGPHHFHDVPSDFVPQDFGPWQEPLDPESLLSKYLVALRYQDLFLQRLYEQLDATGLSENTYVVIVGDHGEAFDEHGFDKHGNNVFEEGMLVPFSLTGPSDDPRIAPGASLDRAGMHADIAPTILDLLGLWKEPAAPPGRPPHRSPEELLARLERKQQRLSENIRLAREGSPTLPPRGGVRGTSDASKDPDRSKGRRGRPPLGGAGSGLVGDSLIGPDFRSCAVAATHYGGKTLAVVAGEWKGLFMYRWEKLGERTHAEVEEAQLFDLSVDPRETNNLMKDADRGSCCLAAMFAAEETPEGPSRPPWEGDVAVSCYEAAQYPTNLLERGGQEGDRGALVSKAEVFALEVCCHLETAAVAFAGDNLEFFGRQGYEQEGEDKQPIVKQPAANHFENNEDDLGHDNSQYGVDQFNDGEYDDAMYDDGQHDDAQYNDGRYDDGKYDDGQYDDGEYDDARYDDGQHDDAHYNDGRYDDGRYDDGQYNDGEHDESRYDDGQYDDDEYGDAGFDDVPYDDGEHDDVQYDDGRYDDGQYDDGEYDDAGNDDVPYDDGDYDHSIATDNTGEDPALIPSAPGADQFSDPSIPNSANSPDNAQNDRDEPPMKVDLDGPYAYGRSYSDYNDDHYHGYSSNVDEGKEPAYTSPAPGIPADESGSDKGGSSEPPLQPTPPPPPPPPTLPSSGNDASPTLPMDNNDPAAPICVPDYSSGMIETVASSLEERIEVVTMDSQGNTFYTLSYGRGTADTIRRAAPFSFNITAVDGPKRGEDALIYSGTGVILSMTVDADDNLVFSMEDAPAVSGGVFMLKMGPGGELLTQDEGGELDGGAEASFDDTTAPALLLANGLGPFLPGVAVCPVSEDIYVSRGHTGITRLVKDTDGGFSTKVEWDVQDLSFDDKGTTRVPLMIWDIAVNSMGIVYLTTYVQGVVLKAIFPKNGASAKVRLVAGSWNSGVNASSGDGGKASSAVMAYPKALAISADDAVYVGEFQGQKIRRVSTNGMISTVAGTGSTVNEGDGGPASEAGLDLPNAIAFVPGKSGSKMAIADFGHSVVRVIEPALLCA